MKKGAIWIFAIFYLLVSTGLSLDVHYCGGNVVDVEVFGAPDNCCSESQQSCSTEKTNDCCDDKTVLVQLDEWQISPSVPTLEVVKLVLPRLPLLDIANEAVKSGFEITKDLPPPKTQPLWLLYGALTYYG